MGVGTIPGRGIPEGERGANKTHCVSLVQSKYRDENPCRRLRIWPRCCPVTASPLLGTTQLDSMPPRVLRFQLHLTRFDCSIADAHVPGMYLYTADTPSCAPIKSVECVYKDDKDVERFVEILVERLPASEEGM